METHVQPNRPPGQPPHIGDLLHRIVDDLKLIAKDEAELASAEVSRAAKSATADAAGVLLSGLVALIGLAFAGAAAVDALSPLIPQLWARLLIMGVVYIVVGAFVARGLAGRLSRDVVPDLAEPAAEAKETARDIERGLTH